MENNVFSDCLIWWEFSAWFQEYDLKKFRKDEASKIIYSNKHLIGKVCWSFTPSAFLLSSSLHLGDSEIEYKQIYDILIIDGDLILPISVIRHSFLYSNWKSLRHPSPQTHCVTPSLATMLQPAPARSNLEMDFILTFTLGSLWFLARLAKPTCEKENSQWS